MIQGFKEFILRGNVIELAVAFVIGAAFSAVVDTLVSSLINPLVGAIFNASSLDTAMQVEIPSLTGEPAVLGFGAVLGALLNFLIIAIVVYLAFVLPMNKLNERRKGAEDEAPAEPTETELLVEIRDLLAQRTGKDS